MPFCLSSWLISHRLRGLSLARLSTQKWAKVYDWHHAADKTTADPELAKRYKALPKQARKTIDDMLKHMYETRRQLRALIVRNIEGTLTSDEFKALPPEAKKARRELVAKQKRLLDTQLPMMDGPYMPLSRFGNYVAVAKSAEYVKLEDIPLADRTDEQRARMDELRASAEGYIVSFADSLGKAERIVADWKSQFPDMQVEAYERALEADPRHEGARRGLREALARRNGS